MNKIYNKSLISELQSTQENANHYNTIGWFIISLFFIFLGSTITQLDISQNNLNTKLVNTFIILLALIFGLVSYSLFKKSQDKKFLFYITHHKIQEKLGLPTKEPSYKYFWLTIHAVLLWTIITGLVFLLVFIWV